MVAVGVTVDVARRLSGLGDRPAIHITATTFARIAGRAIGEPLGPLAMKGKGEVEVVALQPLTPRRSVAHKPAGRELVLRRVRVEGYMGFQLGKGMTPMRSRSWTVLPGPPFARLAHQLAACAAAALAVIGLAWPGGTAAQETLSLDQLIEQFDAGRPAVPGSARLDAWAEDGDAGRAVVIVITPEGETKLVADPGITVTPITAGVDWLLPLPHRLVDPSTDYFSPPATIRLPYESAEGETVSLLVEYAYCVIDFQCFFGEETLVVALDGS